MGSYPTVPTVQAVKKSQAWREKLDQGINPKEEELELKNQIKRNRKLRERLSVKLHKIGTTSKLRDLIVVRKITRGHNAIKKHMFPILEKRQIGSIKFEEVVEALRTIWEEIPPTAWKIQGAMRQIFEHAGLKEEQNVARWKDNLDQKLPHPDEFHEEQQRPSLNWQLVPEFMEKLQDYETIGAKALMLHILTVGEVKQRASY